ncbi:MAG: hypothetical protein RLY71_2428 [Pseudomonadota bacterium]|jgi:hydrogenase maturation protease
MNGTLPRPRLVLCFGNELHGDDGFGPAVGRRLADDPARPLPPGWQLHQIGTRGLDALALLHDCAAAILVDAAEPQGQPGRLCTPDLAGMAPEPVLAGHGLGIGSLLQALHALHDAAGPTPRPGPALRLLTAEMSALTPFRLGLSEAVEAAVAPAAAQVRQWMEGFDTDVAFR